MYIRNDTKAPASPQRLSSSKTRIKTTLLAAESSTLVRTQRLSSSKTRIKTIWRISQSFSISAQRLSSSKTRIKTIGNNAIDMFEHISSETKFQ